MAHARLKTAISKYKIPCVISLFTKGVSSSLVKLRGQRTITTTQKIVGRTKKYRRWAADKNGNKSSIKAKNTDICNYKTCNNKEQNKEHKSERKEQRSMHIKDIPQQEQRNIQLEDMLQWELQVTLRIRTY